MWIEAIAAGVMLARYSYHRWIEGDPKRQRNPAQEVQVPRTDEGAPVPLVFGRTRVRAPILAWMGNLQYADNASPAYRSFALDMLFVVGIPMGSGVTRGNRLAGPKLHAVWFGDKKLPMAGVGALPAFESALYDGQMVARPTQYGGPGAGGGLKGAYWWHGGWTDQSFTAPASKVGDRMLAVGLTRIPGLARQMCVSFGKLPPDSSDPYFNSTRPDQGGSSVAAAYPGQGFVFGESGSINSMSVEVSTYGDRINDVTGQHIFTMQNEGSDFGGDSDPAEVIYCVLTDPLGKLALSPSTIDTASFAAASQTLKSENHGYSRAWEDTQEANEIINDVLRQIDGALDENPKTGKIQLKLIRPDFDPATIPHITRANCEKIMGLTVAGLTNVVNVVRVTYPNRARDYKDDSEVAKNPANAVGQGGQVNEEEVQFRGCNRAALANQLAGRELAARSRRIVKCRAMCGRWARDLMRGDAVKLTWQNPDVAGEVFRVADVERGTLEDGAVAVDLISDYFFTWRGQAPVPGSFGEGLGLDDLDIGVGP